MKKSILLGILTLLILVAMCLPGAAYQSWSEPGMTHYYLSNPLYFLGAFTIGGLYLTLSLFWASLAPIFAFLSAKSRVCSIICSVLLLLSAASLIVDGAPTFGSFSPMSWIILAALVGTGLFALLGFRRKTAK